MTALRDGLPQRGLGLVAVMAAMVLLAVVLAHWGWRALGPAGLSAVPPPQADPLMALRASGLLASPTAAPAKVGPGEGLSAVSSDLRLLGVMAEKGDQGYALFRLATGPRLVRAGQEVWPGTRLVSVRPQGVTLREAGGERELLLRPLPGTTVKASAVTRSSATPIAAACRPPPGFTGQVLRVNAELFAGIINERETWVALVAPEKGGLAVRDDSGFLAMLAMRRGDRLEQANGVALTSADDVVAAVLKPLAAREPVRVTGTRAGARREWLILNAGSCPA